MVTPVPSLGGTGWVTEIAERADKLTSYFFISDYSQSTLYEGNITSLPWLIQQFGQDETALVRETREALQVYFGRYFEQVQVDVSTQVDDSEAPGTINMRIDVTVYENGQKYSLGRLVSSLDSKITKIITLNNG